MIINVKPTSKTKPRRKRIDSPFAKNLKRILDERGISLRAAAELAGVAPSVVSSWLTGGQAHDALAVQKLAIATKVSFEWLLTGKVTEVGTKDLSLAEIFEEQSCGFEGIYKISATRLVRRGEK